MEEKNIKTKAAKAAKTMSEDAVKTASKTAVKAASKTAAKAASKSLESAKAPRTSALARKGKALMKEIEELQFEFNLPGGALLIEGEALAHGISSDMPFKPTPVQIYSLGFGSDFRFFINEKTELNVLVDAKQYKNLLKASSSAYMLLLEKAILRHLPKDFGDVWAIAISRIQDEGMQDHDALLAQIKLENPWLFYNPQDFAPLNR